MPARRHSIVARADSIARLERIAVAGEQDDGERLTLAERLNYSARRLGAAYITHFWLQITMCALSTLSCGFYVLETYFEDGDDMPLALEIVELAFTVYFLVDYLLTLAVAEEKLRYVLSLQSLVDLVSLLPGLSVLLPVIDVGFLRFLRVGKSLRLLRLHRVLAMNRGKSNVGAVQRTLISLIVHIGGIIFVAAGTIHVLEHAAADQFTNSEPLQWHDCLYFVVVTFSTVGYGDISPLSSASRMVIIVFIGLAFTLVPYKASLLVEAFASQSRYLHALRLPHGAQHVVVLGHVTDVDGLRTFLGELLHSSHGLRATRIKAAVLGPEEPSAELECFLESTLCENSVTFVKGSPMLPEDLERVRLADAFAVFVLTGKSSNDDKQAILCAVSALKLDPAARLFVQVTHAASRQYLANAGVAFSLSCLELKLGIMAHSARMPGLLALVSNLVSSEQGDMVLLGHEAPWYKEYVVGAGAGLFCLECGRAFAGMSFAQLAALFLDRYGAVLVGAKTLYGAVRLNPRDMTMDEGSRLFCLAYSEEEIVAMHLSSGVVDQAAVEVEVEEVELEEVVEEEEGEPPPQDEPQDDPQDDPQDRKQAQQTLDLAQATLSALDLGLPESGRRLLALTQQLQGVVAQLHAPPASALRDHVVLLGRAPLELFLRPLRAVEPRLPVVVLHDDRDAFAEGLQRCAPAEQTNVFFVEGLASNPADLRSVRVGAARAAVLLSDADDADALLTCIELEASGQMGPAAAAGEDLNLVVELQESRSVRFLGAPVADRRHQSAGSRQQLLADKAALAQRTHEALCAPIASGRVYSASIMDSLLAQLLYDKEEVEFWGELLLEGGAAQRLRLRPVPPAFVGRPYAELARRLLRRERVVLLGLLRARGVLGAPMQYVVAHPPPELKLRAGDRLYALGAG